MGRGNGRGGSSGGGSIGGGGGVSDVMVVMWHRKGCGSGRGGLKRSENEKKVRGRNPWEEEGLKSAV